MNEETEYVYRLVDEATGKHLKAYQGQHVFTEIGIARRQATKFNNKTWRHEKAVIQCGTITWSNEDPL